MHIFMTGASGIVGSLLRPLLAERGTPVVVNSRGRLSPLHKNESLAQGDICDVDFIEAQIASADAVIHLASSVGAAFTFEQVLGPNVQGMWNVLRACQRNGTRLVYASSHHAIGFLTRGADTYGIDAPMHADSPYGLSKAFSELMARYFFDRYGLQSMGIRIGSLAEDVIDERRLHTWCSAGDLLQLIDIGLTRDDLGHRVVFGLSDNPDPFFENAAASEIGYAPKDKAVDNLADPILWNAQPDPKDPSTRFVGGFFALADTDKLLEE